MITSKIQLATDRIAAFCRKWLITEFSIFGSALRDDFRPDSDIDILIAFEANTERTLEDWLSMNAELEAMLGYRVDLVERRLVEQSENYIRRRDILESAEQLYAAR
jgi:predicted nucleotidyltransferase